VGTNQKPAQLIVRRISDCAVVRSTTDGHDAHVAFRSIEYPSVEYRYIDFHYFDRTNIKRGRYSDK